MEQSGKPTILVVEDDTDIRESVVDYLEMMDFKVYGVCNGQDALEFLRVHNEKPDLILLDLMMPILDGFGFREAQILDDRLKDIPVLIMSADGHVQEKQNKVGARGYLKKPVDLDVLEAEIHRCIK